MLPTNTTKNYYDLLKQWIRHYSQSTLHNTNICIQRKLITKLTNK